MDYLRSGTREQSSDHIPVLKSYFLGKDLGSGRKLEGQDRGLRKGAIRIGGSWKGGLELGMGRQLGLEFPV